MNSHFVTCLEASPFYLSTPSFKAWFWKLVFFFRQLAAGRSTCTASCTVAVTAGDGEEILNNHHYNFFGKAKHPFKKKQKQTPILGCWRQPDRCEHAFATTQQQWSQWEVSGKWLYESVIEALTPRDYQDMAPTFRSSSSAFASF